MNATYFLLIVIPIIAFVAVDAFAGLRAGVISAMLLALIAFCANIYLIKTFEASSLIEPILILLLGWITLKFKDPRFIKFQPVITNGVFAVLLMYYQIFDTPFLQKYMPLFSHTMPPETQGIIMSPQFLVCMGALSKHLIYLFIVHGALVTWAALRLSNWWWLAARLAGYPMMIALMIFEILPSIQKVSP